jgi:hypothetical protein
METERKPQPQRVYIDGSREIWELPDGSFAVITPVGSFLCHGNLDEARYLIDKQGLLTKGGITHV